MTIPQERYESLWPASDAAIFHWLEDRSVRYEPLGTSRTVGERPRAMYNGILMAELAGRDRVHCRKYVAIERSGIVELGLGNVTASASANRMAFLFTPIVANIWHLLGFVSDLYHHLKVSGSFSLVVAFRQTAGAMLAGLAKGWEDPWPDYSDYRPLCAEPAFMLTHHSVGPSFDSTSARALAREVAYEIEAAWGHGGPGCVARCFRRAEGDSEGEFDTNAARR